MARWWLSRLRSDTRQLGWITARIDKTRNPSLYGWETISQIRGSNDDVKEFGDFLREA